MKQMKEFALGKDNSMRGTKLVVGERVGLAYLISQVMLNLKGNIRTLVFTNNDNTRYVLSCIEEQDIDESQSQEWKNNVSILKLSKHWTLDEINDAILDFEAISVLILLDAEIIESLNQHHLGEGISNISKEHKIGISLMFSNSHESQDYSVLRDSLDALVEFTGVPNMGNKPKAPAKY